MADGSFSIASNKARISPTQPPESISAGEPFWLLTVPGTARSVRRKSVSVRPDAAKLGKTFQREISVGAREENGGIVLRYRATRLIDPSTSVREELAV